MRVHGTGCRRNNIPNVVVAALGCRAWYDQKFDMTKNKDVAKIPAWPGSAKAKKSEGGYARIWKNLGKEVHLISGNKN